MVHEPHTLLEHMNTPNTNGRAALTPLKYGGDLRDSGRVSSSCYKGGTHRVKLSFHIFF